MSGSTVPGGTVHALPSPTDPRIAEVRDVLLGASSQGFVSAVIVGFHPRDGGVAVIGAGGLDAMRTVGALEVAKSDVVLQLRMGQRSPPPMPPSGGEPERKL